VRVARAKRDVERSEKAESAREQDLDDATLSLKQEMVRVMKSRRSKLAKAALGYATILSSTGGARKGAWAETNAKIAAGKDAELASSRARVVAYAKREQHAGVTAISETREQRRAIVEDARSAPRAWAPEVSEQSATSLPTDEEGTFD
jgi:hypothetical protein